MPSFSPGGREFRYRRRRGDGCRVSSRGKPGRCPRRSGEVEWCRPRCRERSVGNRKCSRDNLGWRRALRRHGRGGSEGRREPVLMAGRCPRDGSDVHNHRRRDVAAPGRPSCGASQPQAMPARAVRVFDVQPVAACSLVEHPTQNGTAKPAVGGVPQSLGIPIFLSDPKMAEHDEHQHHQSEPHKLAQAAHFDDVEEQEFEIVRPHQTPRLYRFLLAEKFRRSVSPIRPHLVGASALSVCGGSGMDAEFIVGTGAIVTTSDLSLGAATRAMARSRRYGLGIQSIVADVEHLPFADESIDLVAVHDGLHHLDDPYVGLSEMARVARRWVVITEPAQAWLTRLAVRLGLALDTEPAGNRVARLSPPQAQDFW